ncbi:arsenate reductase (glutaredoxin) [Corynebacterium pseudotuberculosis]|uniref:Arsenate reductase (Glutaredoxin) n=1 Tax=Corynebacterium pseudotuberculosis 258 TaxID=1168865 RepID=A0AAU8PKP1_CORPS|nr:arsenate reductase (glutaredoxin) [Corynebacterium pseudotuberculosis]AER68827.1 Arsenate reductase [Corynebacterium pseudotuberculosis 1/06-A]AEQ06321.1 arsenate reductase (glutaredoxin) [Corynebacterium pseudotuberculosis CIP 52.97]AFB72102.1 arsenate reductase (glutaredoxin) [Corynebacterium pseudotuberculosis 316]AFH90589.1 arsenate reductase (glutaredoxin) [Corynebacterium pseudotuberculosis 31]AFK16406.1 arsenate reductase (glutaredoxin) [Corynebacterium pseudotuberculosis 258]
MITIYHNSHCSKSRAALEFLQDRGGEDVQIINYLSSPPSEDALRELLHKAGLTPHQAIRTNEQLYQELGLSPETSDDELIATMVKHPQLIQRPFVSTDKGVRLARPMEVIEEIL